MHIAKMEAIPVAYPEPNDFDATRYLCLVKLTADDGTVGWGESITQFAEANAATCRAHRRPRRVRRRQGPRPIDGDLARPQGPGVVVRLPRRDCVLRHRGHRHRRVGPQGQGPRAQRLRPARRPDARAPAGDRLVARPLRVDPGDGRRGPGLVDATGCTASRSASASAATPDLGYEHDRDVEYVRAMREGIGDDKQLIVDLGIAIKWDVATAVKRVQAFDELRPHLDRGAARRLGPRGLRHVASEDEDADRLRRAGVERRRVRACPGDRDLRRDRLRPGSSRGDHRASRRSPSECEAYRRQANAHAWSSAIVTAASLAISFSSTACKVFEVKPLRNPMQHDLVTEPFAVESGFVYPPVDRPGLGHRSDRRGGRPLPRAAGAVIDESRRPTGRPGPDDRANRPHRHPRPARPHVSRQQVPDDPSLDDHHPGAHVRRCRRRGVRRRRGRRSRGDRRASSATRSLRN